METTAIQTAAAEPTADERNWAVGAHLSGFAGAIVAFGNLVAPLILYLIKRTESRFIAEHARAALNFQITITLVSLIGAVVAFAGFFSTLTFTKTGPNEAANAAAAGSFVVAMVVFGVLVTAFSIWIIVVMVQGAIAAGNGRPYRYPFSWTFVKDQGVST